MLLKDIETVVIIGANKQRQEIAKSDYDSKVHKLAKDPATETDKPAAKPAKS